MTSTTNEDADYFLWEISNKDSNRIIMSSEINLSPHVTHSESKCLPFGECSLVTRSDNQTTSENASYSLEVSDELIYDRSTNGHFESEYYFTVYSSDSDCDDFDGCATDICDPETRLCKS